MTTMLNYDDKVGYYPLDWACSRFKDFSILQRGKDLTDNEVVPGIYPVVKSNGISIFHKEYFVEPPGVVTGRSGTIGEVFFIENKFWSHNTTLYVKDFKGNNPKYIYYLIKRMDFRRYYAGTTIPTLNRNDIHRLKIAVPSNKSEQTVITEVLSKVDGAIQATENSIKAAERLKKGLMQNLLTGKLKPDGTWRKEDEYYVNEKSGRIPIGWDVSPIGSLINRKTEPFDPLKSKEVFDYVGLEHVIPNEFIRNGKGKSDETLALKVRFKKGDLLYGKLRPYLNKVWIADLDGVGSTEFIVFENNLFTHWIYLSLQSKRFLNFTESMTAGTQHPRVSWRDVKRFQLAFPTSKQERDSIVKLLLSTEQQKSRKQEKILVLINLKKSLMQNLLTGKIRVDVDKINKLLNEK